MVGGPDIFWLQICGMQENEVRLRRMARASKEALFPLVLMSVSFSVHLPVSLESADSGFLFFCPFTHHCGSILYSPAPVFIPVPGTFSSSPPELSRMVTSSCTQQRHESLHSYPSWYFETYLDGFIRSLEQ